MLVPKKKKKEKINERKECVEYKTAISFHSSLVYN